MEQSYLPSQTPSGLRRLREEDLENLRGNGEGERKSFERIYNYDVYNDLGDPDKSLKLQRPVLGGKEHPYPRRCRTGRPHCDSDPRSEKRRNRFYVPRDECFLEIKQLTFSDTGGDVLRFETPEAMNRDKFFWFRDEEFARQTLSGLNPYSIQLVTEWPLKSKLELDIYGPPKSAITTEMIEEEIGGLMSVDKKLFMLDYHDILLPFVDKVRRLEGTTVYGSRTLFFLTKDGTLRPLAIEFTCPPMDGKQQWKQVFRPSWYSTCIWLWRIAKAHVLAHDSGYQQLVSHW
ncbi:hypothetical protein FH972_009685 [Carpinus fangiana]|uniref:Lipoxygenase domain-containing protein n=1 Tax=Carpinus fangiana TaxID=176857 RepID=A0A660KMY4_9ROSI|nr:hypothetical protein FH972_009685 [Carpinus fangiana]